MWYSPTTTVLPAAEPITTEEVKAYTRIDFVDDDGEVEILIASARSHVENYTNTRLVEQTVALKCDEFCDFKRLPIGPVQSVTSIVYTDTNGDEQTLSTDVYELRSDGLDASIDLKYGQAWPAIRMGSRITVSAVVGYVALPPEIKHALLLFVADSYGTREAKERENYSTFDSLLANHCRGL